MPSSVEYIGWGSGPWGTTAWGTDLTIVYVDGVAAEAAVGTVSVVAEANVVVTGVEAVGHINDVGIDAEADVLVQAVSAVGHIGTVTVTAAAEVPVTGVEADGVTGDVTVTGEANVSATGVEADGVIGDATVDAEANVPVTGVEAVGDVGDVTVTGTATVEPTGVEADGLVPTSGPTFTASGNAALSTDQKKFGTASLELDGTGDYVKSASNSAVDGNFTVEFFVYASDFLQDAFLWDTQVSNSGLAISITSLGKLRVVPMRWPIGPGRPIRSTSMFIAMEYITHHAARIPAKKPSHSALRIQSLICMGFPIPPLRFKCQTFKCQTNEN